MTTSAGSRTLPFAAAAALIVATAMIISLVILAGGLQSNSVEQAEVANVVEAMATESSAVTEGYLAGPESVAQVVELSLQRDLNNGDIVALLSNLTVSQANVDGAFVGYPDGSFLDVRREFGTVSGLRIKTIIVTPESRAVEVEIIDPASGGVRSFPLPNDTFDPRMRPWYIGAAEGAAEHWTNPYTFFSSNEPGITYSRPVFDEFGTQMAVVGVDIRLADLDSFLLGRRPSENGGAAVLNNRGDLIAGSTTLIDTPAGKQAIDRLFSAVTESSTPTVLRLNGANPGIVVGTRLNDQATQMLLIDAPDGDFLQSIRTSRQNYALLASVLGGVGVLLLLVGVFVTRRHLRTLGQLAETDALTGLLNRAAVYDQASEALELGKDVAVMAIDLDDFKQVNDQFGHEGGDRALLRVAQRVQASSPRNAVLGRLGGDEFTIVLIDCLDPGRVFRSIIEAAAGTVESPSYTFDIQLSAGYTISDSSKNESLRDLFRRADVALYKAKTHRGTAVVQFDRAMHLRWRRDDERRKALRDAIHNREMKLHFQPEFDLGTGCLVGAEGLLRWHHPDHGLIPATDFIEDLERFSLFPSLLPVLFENALTLSLAMPPEEQFMIRLNVSADQLADPNLVRYLQRATAPVDTTWCLEVTEHAIVDASPNVRDALDQIRALGISIALDDFGTGYSSFHELQGLPIDAIKIDRVFVARLDDTQDTKSIAAVLVGLAESLNIEVIAEGIETEQQRVALIDAGCTRGQGYLLGRPIDVHEFIDTWGLKTPANEVQKKRAS